MTMVKWGDVKDDYARKDAEIEELKLKLFDRNKCLMQLGDIRRYDIIGGEMDGTCMNGEYVKYYDAMKLIDGHKKSMWALEAMENLSAMSAKEFNEYLSSCVESF